MKILIAEDDLTSRRILEGILNKWGYNVESVANGNEAWEKLQRPDAPKLAVLDWMMPGINGVDICRRLRETERNRSLYIIILTAKDDKKDIIEGLKAGANDYIAKPFDNEELQARLEVGRRILELQEIVVEKEKLQGVLEMAGAVCHELNQPIQVISGYSELLLMDIPKDNFLYANIKKINEQIEKMGTITKKLANVTKYKTKDYLNTKIIDIDEASIENF